jgi:hypothetical protein
LRVSRVSSRGCRLAAIENTHSGCRSAQRSSARAAVAFRVLEPLGLVPLGLVPLGLVPLGLVPLGLVPLGLAPLGLVPLDRARRTARALHVFSRHAEGLPGQSRPPTYPRN